VRTNVGGVPLTPGSIGARPGLGLFGDNPAFAVGGSAGMIAPDSQNALRPAALGAYREVPDVLGRGAAGDGSLALEGMNASPGQDFPAGVLGIDPARAAAVAATQGAGALTAAALVAHQLPAAGNTGVGQLISDIGNAISSVVNGLPDWSRPIILVLLALSLAFGVRAMWNGRRARRFRARLAEETQRNEVLAAENAVMQRALVPTLPERLGGVTLSAHYRPADLSGAGGDFYDVFALDSQRVAIILGDVSGHDRHAVDRANAIRHKLRTHLEDDHEPRIVLKKTGAALARDETLDGDFATAVVAVHDTAAGTLTYACAGHPAPVLIGAADHEPVSVCSSPALGWGIPTGRRQTTVVLGDGDTACFYTDGLIEARKDGGFLGRDGLEALVRELGADGTARDLLTKVIDMAHEADDDLAALIVRAGTPTTPRGLRVEELEFSDHDVRRKAPERFLAACGAPEEAIDQLSTAMELAVAETGRALLTLTFDPAAGDTDAAVEPIGAARVSVDPRVLVGD
jgi:serine phosphatase RsbU (regulator of sigma subunit)